MPSVQELESLHRQFKELETTVLRLIDNAERRITPPAEARLVGNPDPLEFDRSPEVVVPSVPRRMRR